MNHLQLAQLLLTAAGPTKVLSMLATDPAADLVPCTITNFTFNTDTGEVALTVQHVSISESGPDWTADDWEWQHEHPVTFAGDSIVLGNY